MNDGGPAFPLAAGTGDPRDGVHCQTGMSLRDWFASQERINHDDDLGWPLLEALAGRRPSGNWDTNPREWFEWSNRWQAAVKFARADAMLKQSRITAEDQSASDAEARAQLARKAQAISDQRDADEGHGVYAYASARDAMLKARDGGSPKDGDIQEPKEADEVRAYRAIIDIAMRNREGGPL